MDCGTDTIDTICNGGKNKKEWERLKEMEAEDADATNLSSVGTAIYEKLRKTHAWHHNKLWDVTTGLMVGEVHQTPGNDESFKNKKDVKAGTSDWFPEKMFEIMSRTEVWCDILSLSPPDGKFFEEMKSALKIIAARAQPPEQAPSSIAKPPVIIRIMFGNLPAMPVNCDAVIKALTQDLPNDGSIHVWVGAWRFGVSWNHAKIIAVDGKYLHQGGHNMWDGHYLQNKPVHDLSMELHGRITLDAHLFANSQWEFIRKKQGTFLGQIAEKIPDYLPLLWNSRVIVSEFPSGLATEFPPVFELASVPYYNKMKKSVPVIAVGRLGGMMTALHPILRKDRPSDDAFLAMIDSAQSNIKLALQDVGPVCFPGTKNPLPGTKWPKPYLTALGRALYERSVDIEMVLSNPGSIPNDLSPTEANYGNGWSCVDVAAEIIKRIKKTYPGAEDSVLRQRVTENLRISFIRQGQGRTYKDGTSIGLHSKHFIVDDVCTYIGSQNLYVCDLAEWGVIIDDKNTTKNIIDQYWAPLWKASYDANDCDVDEVMDGLDIDRDGEEAEAKKAVESMKVTMNHPSKNSAFYGSD